MNRYMDVSKLYEKAVKLEDEALQQMLKIENDKDEFVRWNAILNERTAFKFDIFDAPSADVRENTHAEWIEMNTNDDGTHNIRCSLCGHGYKSRGHARSLNTQERFKFCPHCGSVMDANQQA